MDGWMDMVWTEPLLDSEENWLAYVRFNPQIKSKETWFEIDLVINK